MDEHDNESGILPKEGQHVAPVGASIGNMMSAPFPEECEHREARNTPTNASREVEIHKARTLFSDPQELQVTVSVPHSNLPERLHGIFRMLKQLDHQDLIAVAEHANSMTIKHVFGTYDASPWYVPEIRLVKQDEPQWSCRWEAERWGAVATVFGREVRVSLAWWIVLTSILILGWYSLYNILGADLMTRGGYVWDPLVTVIVCSVVGGTLCRMLGLPALLGIIWMGILWNNIPEPHYLTHGIYKDVETIVQRGALVVVLLRAGFSLSIAAIRPHLVESLLLSTLPFTVEATIHAFMANSLFGFHSYTWAFLEGCMCAIVSPAVIVVEIIKLQENGQGQGEGPLSLMLSGVSVEVCAGVWATSFIMDLLFSSGSLATSIVLGPVQLVGGAIFGGAVGWVYFQLVAFLRRIGPRTKTGQSHPQHEALVMNVAFLLMIIVASGFVFFGNNSNLAGGGSVATVAFAGVVAHMWPATTQNRILQRQRKYFAQMLSFAWDMVAMPVLFAIVGASITVKDLFNEEFTPKMIAIVVCACLARMATTFLIQQRRPYDWKQKLLVAGGYAGKASAQASLAPLALVKVMALLELNGPSEELLEKQRIASIVRQAAQFFIICAVPLCTITITKWGSYVLPKKC